MDQTNGRSWFSGFFTDRYGYRKGPDYLLVAFGIIVIAATLSLANANRVTQIARITINESQITRRLEKLRHWKT
jgi:hypothetical protein